MTLLAKILFRIFACIFMRDTDLQFSFIYITLSSFDINEKDRQ